MAKQIKTLTKSGSKLANASVADMAAAKAMLAAKFKSNYDKAAATMAEKAKAENMTLDAYRKRAAARARETMLANALAEVQASKAKGKRTAK